MPPPGTSARRAQALVNYLAPILPRGHLRVIWFGRRRRSSRAPSFVYRLHGERKHLSCGNNLYLGDLEYAAAGVFIASTAVFFAKEMLPVAQRAQGLTIR